MRDLEALRRRRDDAVLALREAAARFPGDREKIAGLEKRARERETALRARVADARVAARDARERREGPSRSVVEHSGNERTDQNGRPLGRDADALSDAPPSLAEQMRAARRGSPAPEGSVRRLVEGDKGPGVFFPSAEFEDKFAKSAGKILKNMKRHAGYVFGLVMNGPGGNAGKGSSGWG